MYPKAGARLNSYQCSYLGSPNAKKRPLRPHLPYGSVRAEGGSEGAEESRERERSQKRERSEERANYN